MNEIRIQKPGELPEGYAVRTFFWRNPPWKPKRAPWLRFERRQAALDRDPARFKRLCLQNGL
jgi:hypothetical protein